MARRYGSVVELWPGTIQVTGAEVVDVVLRRTNLDFFVDRNFLFRRIDHRSGSPDLTNWLKLRRIATSAMTPALLDEQAVWFADRAEKLVGVWLRRRTVPDIMPDLAEITGASIARFGLGGRDVAGVRVATKAMLDALVRVSAGQFELPGYIRALQPSQWRANGRLRDLMGALHAALASDGEGGLIDAISQRNLSETAMITLLRSLSVNGQEAPAAALCWALAELARHPEEQEKAAAAAARWEGSGPVPREISWVVDETLRLWPPARLSGREAAEDVSLGSWTLPAGSTILLPFSAIHRIADCYLEPDRFDSARWATLSPPHGAYVPFGGGPRRCLGARFAQLEIATVLAVVLRRARITMRGEARPDPRRVLTPTGFELEFHARLCHCGQRAWPRPSSRPSRAHGSSPACPVPAPYLLRLPQLARLSRKTIYGTDETAALVLAARPRKCTTSNPSSHNERWLD
jgi:cytochrome P450